MDLRPSARSVCVLLVAASVLAGCNDQATDEPVPDAQQDSLPAQASSTVETPIPGLAPRVGFVETGPMRIDRIYPSMTGPSEWVDLDLTDIGWVTSYKTEVLDLETEEPLGDEYFCHSQLQQLNSTRLMVTATGADEIRFPRGFGMPISQLINALPESERALKFLGMVLNNYDTDIDALVKIRGTIEYYTPEQVGEPARLRRLYKTGLTLEVEDLEAYTPSADAPVNPDITTHCALVNNSNTHWLVPPGPQVTRKRYSDFLPIDGTVHYAVVHLHNYGVYFRLTDATTGEQLWQTDVVYEPDRMQIKKIPIYSSKRGFRIYADHEYEIEAYYNNTTDKNVDAMAQIDLYYRPDGGAVLFFPNPPS